MILLIDNYDSFTYNLVHYFAELGEDVKVVRNDEATAETLFADGNALPEAIVLSPGPCDPDQSGITLSVLADIVENKRNIPILGVCLGHQAIGQYFGAEIIRAQEPVHGKVSEITHNESGIFKDIPSPVTMTRYHSLIIDRESLPDSLEITAYADNGIIMAIAHKTLPIYGVQFHPESIASEYGHKLLENFLSNV